MSFSGWRVDASQYGVRSEGSVISIRTTGSTQPRMHR